MFHLLFGLQFTINGKMETIGKMSARKFNALI